MENKSDPVEPTPQIKRLMRALDNRFRQSRDALDELTNLAERSEEAESDASTSEKIGMNRRTLRDSIYLLDVLRKLVRERSVDELHKAFGAPGDWGYGNELGDALSKLYRGEP